MKTPTATAPQEGTVLSAAYVDAHLELNFRFVPDNTGQETDASSLDSPP